ncbi:MAG TPA: TolC family protein [Verrucomicrobiae bacterium]|nr:TolC family protein [Verrucomicrobiae bacterium]
MDYTQRDPSPRPSPLRKGEEAQKSARLALVAQVGAAYLTEREVSEELDAAGQSLKAAQQIYDLTKRGFEAGVLSQIDLNNSINL